MRSKLVVAITLIIVLVAWFAIYGEVTPEVSKEVAFEQLGDTIRRFTQWLLPLIGIS